MAPTDVAATPGLELRPQGPISDVRSVELRGAIDAALGLSGAAIVGDYLVVGADEGHKLHVLKRSQHGESWKRMYSVALAKGDLEVDIEAITYGDGHLYVVGSHSFRRRPVRPEQSARRNRERLLKIERQGSRNRLYRLRFDAKDGGVGKAERIDLSKRLAKDPLLRPFFGLPSKENGIDIEGLAFHDGQLLIGFRGPVLRQNFVPVMTLCFDQPKRYALRFVRLQGQGIRDLVAIDGGFLIVSGPVNDAPGPFHLWWWDGKDQIPGKDRNIVDARLLGEISTPGGARAEGLAVLDVADGAVDVLLVYETATCAQAVRMRIALPG
ncbi:MAG: DUF3616 domain-containing protein [Gammaproteobacteria bacterium]|nr:DUF3616 domain-containing protein [Gammaproteobacteria bacterium]